MAKEKPEEENKISLEELKKQLENCQREKKEYLAGWQRARADFLNYKKEEKERMESIIKYGREDLILEILPILDSFEKAEKSLSEDFKNNEYIKGFLQIKNQLKEFLRKEGVEEIHCLNEKFDPNYHEAVEMIKRKDKESGIVVEELQKGYKLHGKVIRPAKVKVTE